MRNGLLMYTVSVQAVSPYATLGTPWINGTDKESCINRLDRQLWLHVDNSMPSTLQQTTV